MSFLRSPARRNVLRVMGVVVAVGLATAGPPAYAFAAWQISSISQQNQQVSDPSASQAADSVTSQVCAPGSPRRRTQLRPSASIGPEMACRGVSAG